MLVPVMEMSSTVSAVMHAKTAYKGFGQFPHDEMASFFVDCPLIGMS